MMSRKSFDELKIGDTASLSKIISEEDLQLFAKISMDNNPIHLDETFAKTTRFKKRIAHGMLVASLISSVLANKLPGPGTIYLSQSLTFKLRSLKKTLKRNILSFQRFALIKKKK